MPMTLVRPASLALLLVLAALSPDAARGQTATLAGDLNSTGSLSGPSPRGFHVAGGKLFFLAGPGIWVSDGTSAGTVLLTALCQELGCSPSYHVLGELGGTALWAAEDENGRQLWRSDGTRAGTHRLTGPGTGIGIGHIRTDQGSDEERTHFFFKDAFYFRTCTAFECADWRTDGTLEGTMEIPRLGFNAFAMGDLLFFLDVDSSIRYELRVTDDPSAGGSTLLAILGTASQTFRPTGFEAVGNRLFFFARADGMELWVSDGTAEGTRAVTSFAASNPFSGIDKVIEPDGDRAWFVADDVVHGREIWVSDGTPGGTRQATEFGYDAPMSSGGGSMKAIGGRLVFFATDGIRPRWLWTTTGTPESTASLPSCPSCSLSNWPQLVDAGDELVFLAEDAEHGAEPWRSDGTAAGTRLVADICPGECSSLADERQILPWPGGVLLMAVEDRAFNREIWLSDGTRAGTRRITDLQAFDALEPFDFVAPAALGGRVWFATRYSEGGGLWVTDGTPESARMVTHLGQTGPSSEPGFLTAAADRIWFGVGEGAHYALWSTQGPPESTAPVQTDSVATPPLTVEGLAVAGGLAYLWGRDGGLDDHLWRTDGTPAGTFVVSSALGLSKEGLAFQGRLFFTAWNELWASDGTVQGTELIFSHPRDGDPLLSLSAAGGALYFFVEDEENDTEIWRSDGTAAGTRKLVTTEGFSFDDPEFTAAGPRVYFHRSGRLWKTDGTPEGTAQVLDGFEPRAPTFLTAFQGGLAFFADFPEGGRALWRTDGTAEGTVPVQGGFSAGSFPDTPSELTAFAGRLYFAAEGGEQGTEIWTSDGTAAGTALLRDVFPGRSSSDPRHLTVAGGRLFFTAADPAHGRELWMSDGTAAGTRMVQDLNPYAHPSQPEQLTVAGDRLYFTADDGIAGREVWSLPLAAGAGCQPGSTRLCLNGGRFQVEAAWKDFQGNRGAGQATALTPDTGYFWFFSPANVEAVLKVLDGRGVNDHFWVFYGALSSVEYQLTVTDTQTGAARRYFNPPGQLGSVGDTGGFGPLGAFSSRGAAPATVPCQPTAERLCLNGGRFAVEVAWKDFAGNAGTGKAVNLTADLIGDTGWFWFFDPANVEVMLKVLDGNALNGKHWVFYGALSSVEYTITVTDTQTGVRKTYQNPSGRLASVADTGAF